MKPDMMWIAWEIQRRNRGLADAFGMDLIEYGDLDRLGHTLKKYVVGIWRMTWLLIRQRPKLVVCMYPSIACALTGVIVGRFIDCRVLIDMHNIGVIVAAENRSLLGKLTRWIISNSDYVIVSNINLTEVIVDCGGVPLVLSDKLPTLSVQAPGKIDGPALIVYVTTWSADDPCEEFIEAARSIEPGVAEVIATGRCPETFRTSNNTPSTISFSGFLPEREYIALLNRADIVAILTARKDCLVCGAYEGASLQKVLLLSDTTALREYFGGGSVFAANDHESLSMAIASALRDLDRLKDEVRNRNARIGQRWSDEFSVVRTAIARVVRES